MDPNGDADAKELLPVDCCLLNVECCQLGRLLAEKVRCAVNHMDTIKWKGFGFGFGNHQHASIARCVRLRGKAENLKEKSTRNKRQEARGNFDCSLTENVAAFFPGIAHRWTEIRILGWAPIGLANRCETYFASPTGCQCQIAVVHQKLNRNH